MSRLTGKDALGMFEAYQAVYTHQEEISEEQIWEEVEAWVKSLVEDGNDLSEFTWEEMYEAYLNEYAGGGGPTAQDLINRRSSGPYQSKFARPRNANTGTTFRNSVTKPQIGGITGSTARNYRGQELQAGARAAASQVGTSRQGSAGTGAAPSSAVRPSATPSSAAPPAAPAARPTATAAAKPSSAPAAKPAPTAAAKPATAPVKTPNPLMQRTFGYQTGNAPDQQRARANAIVQSGAVKALAPTPTAAKPSPTPAATGSKKPGSVYSSFDMFDVVKGHLIDEGYAETEEAALAIMANMSEEWKASIIDEATYSAKAARAGKDIGKPGKQFAKIASEAGERYGSKERGEKVAGAVLAKLRAKHG